MQQSFAYVLNRRPFRENSLLIDFFTQDYGRISCIARPAKIRGKVLKGNIEPFRYLHLQWNGKNDLQTLIQADERGRHTIPPSEMLLGLYMNELLLLMTQAHVASNDLFAAYKYTLHKLSDKQINRQILMRFELYLLESLGYSVNSERAMTLQKKDNQPGYIFSLEQGLIAIEKNESSEISVAASGFSGIPISLELIIALQNISEFKEKHWKLLRIFLDEVFKRLTPRTIHSRKLLIF